jgi:hypothetical protein
MYFVPEGQHDRSLARSAWEGGRRENRPVGYGMIGHSYPRSQGYFLSKMCAVSIRKATRFMPLASRGGEILRYPESKAEGFDNLISDNDRGNWDK